MPVAFGVGGQPDLGHCLRSGASKADKHESTTYIAQPYAVGTDCYNGAITGEVAATLGTPGSSVNATGPTVMQPVGIFQDSEFGVAQYDSAGTLRAGQIPEHQMVMQLIAFHPTQTPISSAEVCHAIGANGNATAAVAVDTYNHTVTGDYTGSLTTTGGPPLSGPGVLQAMQVRRLTPVECERLMGFHDNYTAIPWRNKPADQCPDGPRYKALGNSWAVPVVRWIGERIARGLSPRRP